ncbi:c-type cytochrome [Magnetospirillum moscoviense]|uniref:Cytochrome C n=1 Tax=Magnetospirillum moscoviense TaxID=1437059 RepID=A0A178MGT9_9PROT|nr:c-type cytochrome [Magnetospirillum moscoviense]OAN47901.1 cytochrome C [Magnetospirillum moscoviense]
MKTLIRAVAVALVATAAFGTAAYAAGAKDKPAQGKSLGDKDYQWNANGGEKDEALHLKPDLANGRDVYEVCAACHLPEGWGQTDGTFPQLAGQHNKVIIKQLADIRALNRDNPTMYPFALPDQIGGPQAIADVAAYIGKLKMNPEPGYGDGKDLEHGKKLYKEQCARCHGDHGQGDNDKYYPRLESQHYNYLLRQYQWIKEGKRRNANPEMVKQIQWMSDRDTKAVLDYVSRIKPPANLIGPKGWKNPDFE